MDKLAKSGSERQRLHVLSFMESRPKNTHEYKRKQSMNIKKIHEHKKGTLVCMNQQEVEVRKQRVMMGYL
jgi:hypothetical protein